MQALSPEILLILLPLLSPLLRPLFPAGRRKVWATILPVAFFLLLILLQLLKGEGGLFVSPLPETGLLLTLCLGVLLLPILLILPERPAAPHAGRLPAVWLPCLLLSAGALGFLGSGPGRVLGGGAGLIFLLFLGALVLDGAFPGAYRRSFLLRLFLSGSISLGLALRPVLLVSLPGEVLFLAALLLLFPAPLSRRTERVVSPEFLKMDVLFFQSLPPLLAFQLLRSVPEGFPGVFPLLGGASLVWGLLGLFRAKTAHYVQEVADGLAAAGMGALTAGMLSGTSQGQAGGLFLAILLPQAALLGGAGPLLACAALPGPDNGGAFRVGDHDCPLAAGLSAGCIPGDEPPSRGRLPRGVAASSRDLGPLPFSGSRGPGRSLLFLFSRARLSSETLFR